MPSDLLRAPRALPEFDAVVRRFETHRFTFTEREAIRLLCEAGQDCHLGEDRRFAQTATNRWKLAGHRVANTLLLNLLVQSWDGSQVERQLARLDAAESAFHILDLGDSRFLFDGTRLRLRKLPFRTFQDVCGESAEGWIPVMSQRQLAGSGDSKPRYTKLRRPVKPGQMLVELDQAAYGEWSRGAVLLCSTEESSVQEAVVGADGEPFAVLCELTLKDFATLLTRDESLPGQTTPAFRELGSLLTRKPQQRGSASTAPREETCTVLLDGEGALYCSIPASIQGSEQRLKLQGKSIAYHSDGLYLLEPAATVSLEIGDSVLALSGPSESLATLFLAAGRSKSRMLKSRLLPRMGRRRLILPPSLASLATELASVPAATALSETDGWIAFEMDCQACHLPLHLADQMGVQLAEDTIALQLVGELPAGQVLDLALDRQVPQFTPSRLPSVRVNLADQNQIEGLALELVTDDGSSAALPLAGGGPWLVELEGLKPGRYAVGLNLQSAAGREKRFEVTTQPSIDTPMATFALIQPDGHPCDTSRPTDLRQLPQDTQVVGPSHWALEAIWVGGGPRQSHDLKLNSSGTLSFREVITRFGSDALHPGLLLLHARGLNTLRLAHQPAAEGPDWESLHDLLRLPLWKVRVLAPLAQRLDAFILPVLAAGGLRVAETGSALNFELSGPAGGSCRLFVTRKLEVEEGSRPSDLFTDGLWWATMKGAKVTIESCIRENDFTPLQNLFDSVGLQ